MPFLFEYGFDLSQSVPNSRSFHYFFDSRKLAGKFWHQANTREQLNALLTEIALDIIFISRFRNWRALGPGLILLWWSFLKYAKRALPRLQLAEGLRHPVTPQEQEGLRHPLLTRILVTAVLAQIVIVTLIKAHAHLGAWLCVFT